MLWNDLQILWKQKYQISTWAPSRRNRFISIYSFREHKFVKMHKLKKCQYIFFSVILFLLDWRTPYWLLLWRSIITTIQYLIFPPFYFPSPTVKFFFTESVSSVLPLSVSEILPSILEYFKNPLKLVLKDLNRVNFFTISKS
jgi:hypothetical protein